MKDPVPAIVAAFVEGARVAASGVMPQPAREAYDALKALLAKVLGGPDAMEALELEPSSAAKRDGLVLAFAGRQSPALREALAVAHRLEEQLKASPRSKFEKIRNPRVHIDYFDRDRFGLDRHHFREAGFDGAEYRVWYGTNRRPTDPADASKAYSTERDAAVHHGSCRVFIPKSHKIGSTGSPWWKRLFTDDDRLKLRETTALGVEEYWRGVAAQLAAVDPGERNAVVFVHGYNVSFEEAALRAAQIGFDLQVRGAMAFFSWPSRGRLDGYLADAATIDASEGAITNFLVGFAERSGASTVHVIAHSMGNRGVLRAVDRIVQGARRRTVKKRFGQVILAAADVDADLFRQRCAAYVELARRTTLYVSTRDIAVEASHWLHDFPRVGLMPPVLVAPGIDTVNVANVDLTRLGHGYVAEARAVLKDMHDLLARGTPPASRFGLSAAETPEGGRFWVIGA